MSSNIYLEGKDIKIGQQAQHTSTQGQQPSLIQVQQYQQQFQQQTNDYYGSIQPLNFIQLQKQQSSEIYRSPSVSSSSPTSSLIHNNLGGGQPNSFFSLYPEDIMPFQNPQLYSRNNAQQVQTNFQQQQIAELNLQKNNFRGATTSSQLSSSSSSTSSTSMNGYETDMIQQQLPPFAMQMNYIAQQQNWQNNAQNFQAKSFARYQKVNFNQNMYPNTLPNLYVQNQLMSAYPFQNGWNLEEIENGSQDSQTYDENDIGNDWQQDDQLKIQVFKVKACERKANHEKKKCPFYHCDSDRRRCPEQFKYSFNDCPKKERCEQGDQCPFGHNKVEQLYHPLRYKAKFCNSYKENNQTCEYEDFCSFAHEENEIVIPMISKLKRDSIFYMYFFKTVWCPNTTEGHERADCPYMHNVQDFRRDPKKFRLDSKQCELWKKCNLKKYSEGDCPKGLNCLNCHGWKELEYHPQIYKTQPCKDKCTKQAECVHYHFPEEQRIVTPTLLQEEERIANSLLLTICKNSDYNVQHGAPLNVFFSQPEQSILTARPQNNCFHKSHHQNNNTNNNIVMNSHNNSNRYNQNNHNNGQTSQINNQKNYVRTKNSNSDNNTYQQVNMPSLNNHQFQNNKQHHTNNSNHNTSNQQYRNQQNSHHSNRNYNYHSNSSNGGGHKSHNNVRVQYEKRAIQPKNNRASEQDQGTQNQTNLNQDQLRDVNNIQPSSEESLIFSNGFLKDISNPISADSETEDLQTHEINRAFSSMYCEGSGFSGIPSIPSFSQGNSSKSSSKVNSNYSISRESSGGKKDISQVPNLLEVNQQHHEQNGTSQFAFAKQGNQNQIPITYPATELYQAFKAQKQGQLYGLMRMNNFSEERIIKLNKQEIKNLRFLSQVQQVQIEQIVSVFIDEDQDYQNMCSHINNF